jgi:hypothetical protein
VDQCDVRRFICLWNRALLPSELAQAPPSVLKLHITLE